MDNPPPHDGEIDRPTGQTLDLTPDPADLQQRTLYATQSIAILLIKSAIAILVCVPFIAVGAVLLAYENTGWGYLLTVGAGFSLIFWIVFVIIDANDTFRKSL